MKSWRFIFIDENESFTISTTQTTIIGYCAIRAPKGTTEATFFEAGNASAIQAMIGVGTSDWPDIKEAIAFNNSYGLWISAPPGSGDGYGSYYGGKYITTKGLKDFYKVEDKDEPNYFTLCDFTEVLINEDGDAPKIQLSLKANDSNRWCFESATEVVLNNGTSEIVFDLQLESPDGGEVYYNNTKHSCGTWEKDPSNNVLITLNGLDDESVFDSETATAVKDEYKCNFKYSVKNITKAYIVQKSCSETETNIVLSHIGYDKYKYNQSFGYMWNQAKESVNTLNSQMSEGEYVAFAGESESYLNGIWTIKEGKPVDVTKDFYTQTIYFRAKKRGSDVVGMPLFYVDKDDTTYTLKQMSVDAKDANLQPKTDIKFNTVTLSCSEQVFPGSQMNGGSWTGSLSETGLDQYGSNIYFPNIFPDDSLTFIEFKVVSTFDDCVDEYGFCNIDRIVDIIGPAADVQEFTIKGQRFVTKLMRDNLNDGVTGGTYRNDHYAIIDAALQELRAPKYDECSVAFECTGNPSLKPTISSIRNSDGGHMFLTLIAPHPITQAEADNPSTITVGGRGRGVAYYVNEFLELCPYTGKKYWACPIGDVALMLATIMDKKLGGCAPAWLNDNGLGGQLSRSVLRAKYDLDDKATKILDEKGLNPIVYKNSTGLMILSHKTTELDAGDWSYLGHSMSFDLYKREIRDKVMRPQLLKAIDAHYMNIRQKEADNILSKRISGHRPIWAEGANYIKEVNTPQTKLQRKFVIKSKVKVNVFSEYVEFVFTNVAQDGTIAIT